MIQLEKNESFSNTFFIEKPFEFINVFLKKIVVKKNYNFLFFLIKFYFAKILD
jgi:hypothetical protein